MIRHLQVWLEGFEHDLPEGGLLLRGEASPVHLETRKRLKSRHQGSATPEVVETGEHRLVGAVHSPSSSGDLLVRLPLTGLLTRDEVPDLVARDGDQAPGSNHPVLAHGKLDLVALADAQRPPDLLRQG